MSRRIAWSNAALDDLDGIVAYLADNDSAAARNAVSKIGIAAGLLGLRPIGRPSRVPETYEKSVTGLPYVIVYAMPDEESLTILRIIHTARNWPHGGWPSPL